MNNPISPDDVWKCSIPDLADVNGILPLDRNLIPNYLKEPLAQMFEAENNNAKLIIVDLRKRKSEEYKTKGVTDRALARDADVYQLLHRGVRNDERFKRYEIISLDDRQNALDQARSHPDVVREFEDQVNQAEETEALDLTAKILVLTPEVESMFSNFERLKSKLQRVFNNGSEKCVIVKMPSPHIPLYETWFKHILAANVDEFRRLFLKAGSKPVQLYDNNTPDTLERALKPLPKGQNFKVAVSQETAFEAALRVMQARTWSDVRLLMHGSYCTGKTTLLVAFAQLMRQLGFKPTYGNYDTEGNLHGYFGGNLTCIDQIDRCSTPKSPAVATSNTPEEITNQDATLDQIEIPVPVNFQEFSSTKFIVHLPGPPWVNPLDL